MQDCILSAFFSPFFLVRFISDTLIPAASKLSYTAAEDPGDPVRRLF
jgi:hypothetical protein